MTPTEYADAVAAEVRAELGRQRRTMADLGKAIHRSAPSVARRLNGEIPFDVIELIQAATWLGVKPEVFLSPRAVIAKSEPAA